MKNTVIIIFLLLFCRNPFAQIYSYNLEFNTTKDSSFHVFFDDKPTRGTISISVDLSSTVGLHNYSIYLKEKRMASLLKENLKLCRFIYRRRHLTWLLFKDTYGCKQCSYNGLYLVPMGEFSVSLANGNWSDNNFLTADREKSLFKYIFYNYPWKIIPSWRLVRKCKKAHAELRKNMPILSTMVQERPQYKPPQ